MTKEKTVQPTTVTPEQRRRFLRLFGTAAALLPITVVTGCGNDAPSAPSGETPAPEPAAPTPQTSTPEPAAAAPEPAPEPVVEEPSNEPQQTEARMAEADADSADMPRVDPNDPTAQALGYQHDAANVDATKYPDRNPAHLCSNCILYQGTPGDEWGGCALFPGKTVNANGWCSSYTPKPS